MTPLSREGNVVDFNARSRRAVLNAGLWSLVDTDRVEPDAEHIITLLSRMGDIADAYRFGHTDISDEMLKVAASALAFVEAREQERAG